MKNTLSTFYIENKPLVNSIIVALLYFIFSYSISWGKGFKGAFYVLMMFLPGVTFPLIAFYSKSRFKSSPKRLVHIVLSIVIYHGCVWLFSGQGGFKYSPLFAGFLGSILFLLTSKYLLKLNLSVKAIMLVALISGFAFIPSLLDDRSVVFLGLPIFLWTIINGAFINYSYKN